MYAFKIQITKFENFSKTLAAVTIRSEINLFSCFFFWGGGGGGGGLILAHLLLLFRRMLTFILNASVLSVRTGFLAGLCGKKNNCCIQIEAMAGTMAEKIETIYNRNITPFC